MSDIDEVKSRLSIVDVIGKRITVKKAGRNFKALCPFHNEKSPSFIISPDRQAFHCFGCGKGGSVFDFVMLYDHMEFGEALETLARDAGVTLTRRVVDAPGNKLKEQLYKVNQLASEYYAYLLVSHKVGETAREYLKHRGVSDKSIKTFGLGYSPNTWDGLYTFLRKKNFDAKFLETAGLVIPGKRGFYDRFRGRVMFTLKDHRGNVVGFSGRVMDPPSHKASEGQVRQEAKYINTSETPVYSKSKVLYALDVTRDAIQKANEAVVMEGELDVISSFQAGIANVVAIKGSAVTQEHAHLLKRYTDRLVFALDSDMAGDAAARRGIEIAETSGFDMRVATMPMGKDPDEAARESAGLLKKAIKEATPMYDYFLSSAASRFDTTSSYGKKKISEEVLPFLAKIENPIVQGHYVRKLAQLLSVSEETVQDGLSRVKINKPIVNRDVTETPTQAKLSRVENLEMYLLALLLQGSTKMFLDDFGKVLQPKDITYAPAGRVIDALLAYVAREQNFSVTAFAQGLSPELVPTFDQAYLLDLSGFIEDPDTTHREWQKTLKDVQIGHIKREIEIKSTALKQDKELSEEAIATLQSEIAQLSAKFRSLEKGV